MGSGNFRECVKGKTKRRNKGKTKKLQAKPGNSINPRKGKSKENKSMIDADVDKTNFHSVRRGYQENKLPRDQWSEKQRSEPEYTYKTLREYYIEAYKFKSTAVVLDKVWKAIHPD